MLRLIVKTNNVFDTYDFDCERLEKAISQYPARKLVGIEIVKVIPISQTLPAGSLPRLASAGDSVINAIKAVRQHTGWGLLEAKEFVCSAPIAFPIMDVENTLKLIRDLQDAGAVVDIPEGVEK